MTSRGQCAASAIATAVLPTAVGPTSTGTLAPAKPALQLLPGKLHDGRAAVHVVRRQVGGKQAEEQLPHLPLVETLPRLHGGSAGVGRGESLQPIGPATEPPTGEVGDHLPETGRGIEARMWGGYGMHHHRASAEGVGLEPDSPQVLTVRLEGIEFLIGQIQGERKQEPLRGRPDTAELRP